MIIVNGIKVDQDAFGDRTLKCEVVDAIGEENMIRWIYDCDSELFTLYCVVRDIQNRMYGAKNFLYMPYIPHARQDRNVSNRLFTLKYFSEIINSLDFAKVIVCDPHSEASTALINRCYTERMTDVERAILTKADAVMFPDAGAAKKYFSYGRPAIIGNKHRNATGRIDNYELLNFDDNIKHVVIRDDICSYGGTFVAAAKALREHGVERVELFVSHCENNILKGEVFKYIDRVYTTDSICTASHPKLTITTGYRELKEDRDVQD